MCVEETQSIKVLSGSPYSSWKSCCWHRLLFERARRAVSSLAHVDDARDKPVLLHADAAAVDERALGDARKVVHDEGVNLVVAHVGRRHLDNDASEGALELADGQ